MSNLQPFSMPQAGSAFQFAVTTSSDPQAFAAPKGNQVLLQNIGATACFVAFGDENVIADNLSACIHANSSRVFSIPQTVTYIDAVTASSTTTLNAFTGNGY